MSEEHGVIPTGRPKIADKMSAQYGRDVRKSRPDVRNLSATPWISSRIRPL